MTRNKGSYIRVFISDLDDDGLPEVIAANKGAQRPGPEDYARSTPVSLFQAQGDPLHPDVHIHTEHESVEETVSRLLAELSFR